MNKHTFIRTLAGLSVIGFGILALLGSLEIIQFSALVGTWWPLILIWVGVLSFVNNPRSWGWPFILVAAGILFQLRELEVVMFNVWKLVWPAIIIAIGVSIILNRARVRRNTDAIDSTSAIFGGHNVRNQSDDYQGGTATAILGGVQIDLSEAKLKKEATLEVFALMGGIEIIVPRDWVVETRVTPILGGAENKASEAKGKTSPKLIIVGEAVMGGIEIKY